MADLKPCPFCGGPANFSDGYPRLYRPEHNKVAVECPECGLVFGWDCDYGGCFETTEEAAAEWNRRAPSKGVPDNSMEVSEPSVQWVSNNTAAQSKEGNVHAVD